MADSKWNDPLYIALHECHERFIECDRERFRGYDWSHAAGYNGDTINHLAGVAIISRELLPDDVTVHGLNCLKSRGFAERRGVFGPQTDSLDAKNP